MLVSPSRSCAFDILLRVEQREAYASELLHSHRLDALSVADRALCTEIVMGVLRWQSRLDDAIAKLSFTPFRKLDREVLTALRIGAYQLMFLARVPPRAAINESVELVKQSRKGSAAGLANVVLRKIGALQTAGEPSAETQRRGASQGMNSLRLRVSAFETQVPPPAELSRELAHPVWLVERWGKNFGPAGAAAICSYDQQVPPTSIRLSPGMNAEDIAAELLRDGVTLASGALLASARTVVAGDITRTAAFRERRIRIQDEGSQLVAALVEPTSPKTGQMRGTKPLRILDCCAAPGGKTAALADRNPGAQVVAVDLHPHRARLLRELVRDPRISVLAADAARLPLHGDFERVLADVPCSGTGTLARNPEIKWRLKPEDLADLHARQVAILRGALERLAPGGRMVYSTCSLEPEECEAVVDEALDGRTGLRVIPAAEELRRLREYGELAADHESLTRGGYLRTVPGIQRCDGFFAAIVAREGASKA